MEDDTRVGANKLFQELHILWGKVVGKRKRWQGEDQDFERLEVPSLYTCAQTPLTPLCLSRCYLPSRPSFSPITLLNTFLKTRANVSPFLAFQSFHVYYILSLRLTYSPLVQELGSKISLLCKKNWGQSVGNP